MPNSAIVLSPQDILAEVRKFISGAARPSHSTNTLELTRTGLSLLKNVPAARDAVLEYLCNVFSVAVNKHVRQIEVIFNHFHSSHFFSFFHNGIIFTFLFDSF